MITPTYTAEFCVFSREIHNACRRVGLVTRMKRKRSAIQPRARAQDGSENKTNDETTRARVSLSLSLNLRNIRTDMNVL